MSRRIGSLCTGYGGLDMAVHAVLSGELAWVADNDPGAAAILAHRFPSVPNLGDITAADWAAVEPVEVLCAGFPCQDVSCGGGRAGLREGTRTGVWAYVARAIDALRPSLVLLENVGGLLSASADSDMEPCPWCLGDGGSESALRALGAVLGDLAEIGFDAQWCSVRASDVGAPHRRERVFILAWPAADAECQPVRGRPGSVGVAPGTDQGPGHQRERFWPDNGAGRAAAQDADRAVGGERREPAPGQAPGGRPRADAGRPGGTPAAPDTERHGWPGWPQGGTGTADEPGEGSRAATAGRGTDAAANSIGDELARESQAQRRSVIRVAPAGSGPGPLDWRQFGPAIARWAAILGRPAPRPTEPGRTGERLSPRFVEWLMGLPDGWVTDVPGLTRNAQLKALGNGVVPAQAAMALRLLLGGLEQPGGAA